MKKILISGDSFACEWSDNLIGWPNLLATKFKVTNVAQAGCGEYKIYQQISSQSLKDFDKIIICHTSPFRIFCKSHPIHFKDPLHKNSDLIYSDVVENLKKNKDLYIIKDYFEKFFDIDYSKFIHKLICKEIVETTLKFPVIHLSFFDYTDLYEFTDFVDCKDIFKKYRGNINHLNIEGNKQVFDKLQFLLE